MSATGWVVTIVVFLVLYQLELFGLRRWIGQLARRKKSTSLRDAESWADRIVERDRAEGTNFRADVLYYAWPIVLGFGVAIAAAIGGWGIGWVVFCALFGLFALSMLLARIKYGRAGFREIFRLWSRDPYRPPKRHH